MFFSTDLSETYPSAFHIPSYLQFLQKPLTAEKLYMPFALPVTLPVPKSSLSSYFSTRKTVQASKMFLRDILFNLGVS